MRGRLAFWLAAVAGSVLAVEGAAAGPVEEVLAEVMGAFGEPPPAGWRVRVACSGFAPFERECDASFDATGAVLFVSSCSGSVDTCGALSGRVRATLTDAATVPDVRDFVFVAGVLVDSRGEGDGRIEGAAFLAIDVEPVESALVAAAGGWRAWIAAP